MPEAPKLRLDVPLVLPDVDDSEDRCVGRLTDALAGRPGIADVHVRVGPDGTPQLCIHYDPDAISLSRVRELVEATGADLSARYSHLIIVGDEPVHARAARRVADRLRAVPGVLEADAAASGVVRIEYDRQRVSEQALLQQVAALGMWRSSPTAGVVSSDAHGDHPASDRGDHGHELGKEENAGHDHAHGGLFGENTELVFATLAGVLLGAGWLIEQSAARASWLPTACYIAAYGFGGFFTGREAVQNLLARRFEIDTLMLVAALGAAALGQWAEGALLLFLFSLGHALEHYAMGRARKAIEALAKLAPETATVRRGKSTEEVGVGQLQMGDVVIVRPNERLPADGVVVLGTSSVNQAPVTGESVPVDKRPLSDAKSALTAFDRVGAEHRVFAGTINGSGAMEVMVARLAEQSTMARVVKMVTEARRSARRHSSSPSDSNASSCHWCWHWWGFCCLPGW